MGVVQMKKRLLKILFFILLAITILAQVSLGYSDDLFEFDLPDGYANFSYQGMYIFTDSNQEDRGFIIYSVEDASIKKSVWDIDQSDLDDLIRKLSSKASLVSTDRKAKLGKEKAVEVILSDDGTYMDLYILASNKYIYMLAFTGNSEDDLKNLDYEMIQDSFKLKDATTNFKLLYIIVIIIIIALSAYLKYRKSIGFPKYSNDSKKQPIDYKNLTEDDFKRM